MTIRYLNPISDRMRYKGTFVGLHLWEERVIIRYIAKAIKAANLNLLSNEQTELVKRALRVFVNNTELTKPTLDKLLDLFYYKLNLPKIEFARDKKGGYLWGGWYTIPGDREGAAKRLHQRRKKRFLYLDDAWYEVFDVSFNYKDLDEQNTNYEKLDEFVTSALSPEDIDEITRNRDPRSAVIVPIDRGRK